MRRFRIEVRFLIGIILTVPLATGAVVVSKLYKLIY
jgi:hypothetical protein